MQRAKVILPVIVAVAVVGGIAALGSADKPEGPPGLSRPLLVSVTGGIQGAGGAALVQVTFADPSFGGLTGTYVANPDGPLEVMGVRKGPRTLRYYYCDACSADDADCCDDPTHDPPHYYALMIYGGALQGKGNDTQIVFPAGSEWQIRSKEPYGAVAATGHLTSPVTYRELD
jgi:hypothetical protein